MKVDVEEVEHLASGVWIWRRITEAQSQRKKQELQSRGKKTKSKEKTKSPESNPDCSRNRWPVLNRLLQQHKTRGSFEKEPEERK